MISFTSAALDHFLSEDDGGPVVMLNLLRFHPEGGKDRYFKYLGVAAPLLTRYGAQVTFAGDGLTPLAAETGQAWDVVALVRYPTRRAFADMVANPDYQAADSMRMSALVEAVLQPIRTLST
jgi:uncharacterized protein (DUF1330 family)